MPIMNRIAKFASSLQGRRAINKAKAYAQSPEGRARIEKARQQLAARRTRSKPR
jgi:hypothetical protein